MFLDPIRGRSRGYVLAAAAVFATGACNDPEQNTDLRPAGPPEVLAVLVATDASAFLYESATYCAPNDEKRPARVGLPDFTLQQICDDDVSAPASMVTDAYPDGWYIRIMFDELLDPNIEELTEILDPDTGMGTDTFSGSIAGTQPVKLECESIGGGFVEVPYDGYYNPAGNAITWPLGPALVIKPDEPRAIATGKMCRITINENVLDKSGEPVPAAQRGPYPFKIAPITPLFIDPADESDVDALAIWYDNPFVTFNTAVDELSFCDKGTAMDECNEFGFTPEIGECSTVGGSGFPTPCNPAMNGADCPTAGDTCDDGKYAYSYGTLQGSTAPFGTLADFGFGPNVPAQTDKEYTFEFRQGGMVADRCGVITTFGAPSVANNTQVTWKTAKFDLNATAPGNGDTASALRKLQLNFNNVIDISTLEPADYTISPVPDSSTGFVDDPLGSTQPVMSGHYALGTEYTFTLKNGAVVNDYWGVPYTQTGGDLTIKWTTQSAVTVAASPPDGGTIKKALDTSSVGVQLSFNQSMDLTSLDASEWTIEPAVAITPAASGCAPTSTSCAFRFRAALVPGDYKFTLKAGATITGVLGATYTQAADRVINFTVSNPEPAVQCL